MSQHLIVDFINRAYVFKPSNDAKLVIHKVKEYQASNRKNNFSPEMAEESTHSLHSIKVKKIQPASDNQQESQDVKPDGHIDITI
ncbi:hypothetical protein [Psychromonas sp. MME2]|uniref:hypothetical protein n=1 Tax=unclassified Psychromonas TaxID=2614957 RepID=UPI00339BE4F8